MLTLKHTALQNSLVSLAMYLQHTARASWGLGEELVVLAGIQDEERALFLCPCMQMCSLRLQCRLVSRFTNGTQNYCQSDWSFLYLPSLF